MKGSLTIGVENREQELEGWSVRPRKWREEVKNPGGRPNVCISIIWSYADHKFLEWRQERLVSKLDMPLSLSHTHTHTHTHTHFTCISNPSIKIQLFKPEKDSQHSLRTHVCLVSSLITLPDISTWNIRWGLCCLPLLLNSIAFFQVLFPSLWITSISSLKEEIYGW